MDLRIISKESILFQGQTNLKFKIIFKNSWLFCLNQDLQDYWINRIVFGFYWMTARKLINLLSFAGRSQIDFSQGGAVEQQKRYRSVLTTDPQKLLDDYHAGEGQVLSDVKGRTSLVVDFNKPIGDVFDERTGALLQSGVTTGSIRYGEGKVHIIPIIYKKTD